MLPRSIYYTHLSSRATPCRFALFGSLAPVASRFVFTSVRIDRVFSLSLSLSLSLSHIRRTITYHFTLILLISHHAFLSSRVLASLILFSNYYKTGFTSSFLFRLTFRKNFSINVSMKLYPHRYIQIKNDRYTRNQIPRTICCRVIYYFTSMLNTFSRRFAIHLVLDCF